MGLCHFQHTVLLDEEDLFKLVDPKEEEANSAAEDMLITKYNHPSTEDILGLSSLTDYTNHIDNVQSDLDSLKDLLHNDSYQLDANQLLGVSISHCASTCMLQIWYEECKSLSLSPKIEVEGELQSNVTYFLSLVCSSQSSNSKMPFDIEYMFQKNITLFIKPTHL
jgi:hypothetical protein